MSDQLLHIQKSLMKTENYPDIFNDYPQIVRDAIVFNKFADTVLVCNEGKIKFIQFRSARRNDGTMPKFPLKVSDKGRRLTQHEALKLFFEQYDSRKLDKVLGNGCHLFLDMKSCRPYLIYEETSELKPIDKETTTMNKNIIYNPISDEAKALIGKRVLASNCLYDFDNTCVQGILKLVEEDSKKCKGVPFYVTLEDNTLLNYSAIMKAPEPEPEPYKLADAKVRDSLMMRVYKSKDASKKYIERMITSFTCDNGSWKVNDMSATYLLQNYMWLDGTPCGELPKDGE